MKRINKIINIHNDIRTDELRLESPTLAWPPCSVNDAYNLLSRCRGKRERLRALFMKQKHETATQPRRDNTRFNLL
jgi:hypothetical protein